MKVEKLELDNACVIAAGFIAAAGVNYSWYENDMRKEPVVKAAVKMVMAIKKELESFHSIV